MHHSPATDFPLIKAKTPETAALIAFVRRLSTARSLSEIMQIATHAARTLLDAQGATFVLRDGGLCHCAEEDAISPLWKGRRVPMSTCIAGWCMLEGKSAAVSDVYQDPRVLHDACRPTFVRSLIMVPVRQDDPIAAIGALWSTTREISRYEVELLQTIADTTALALAYLELQQLKRSVQTRTGFALKFKSFSETIARRIRTMLQAARNAHDARNAHEARESESSPGEKTGKVLLIATSCVSAAALIGLAVTYLLRGNIPAFTVFYPAVLVATLVAGPASGTLAVLLGGLVAWWGFLQPGSAWEAIISVTCYAATSCIICFVAARYRQIIRTLHRKERAHQLANQELQHRARNMVAVVQAVLSRELRGEKERASSIGRKITALASADDLLTSRDQAPRDLMTILQIELEPYGQERFSVAGLQLHLAPELGRALSLVVHEFATNAAKYGALSVPQGRISVSWAVTENEVRLIWQELDGPPLQSPRKRGFGTYFVKRMMTMVGGTIRTDWQRAGVIHELRFPRGDS